MTNKNKGLGKGFDVLMPQGVSAILTDEESERVQKLFISNVKPNPDQPRRHFDEDSLQELSNSIQQHGVLQPLIVTPSQNDGEYMIIAGERRWRASKLAGLDKVPAIVRSSKELEQLELAIVENIQRVDLSPLEEAASIQRLHDLFSQGYDVIARRLGKAESTISNIVRLLQLPPAAQDALQNQRISEGHARTILSLKGFPEAQEQLLLLIQKHGWSVRQAEQFATATKNGAQSMDMAEKKTSASTPETESLTKLFKRQVSISRMAKGGRLVIRFKSDDDLDSLIRQLEGIQK